MTLDHVATYTLADTIALAALIHGATAPPALAWTAAAISTAERRTLTDADHARLASYHGDADALHALLPAVTPLAHPRWWEAAVVAQHGTAMVLGYLAVPAGDALDVGWACYAPTTARLLGPIGPCRVAATGMDRPGDCSDVTWRETRTAAGIILRALLLGLGEPAA